MASPTLAFFILAVSILFVPSTQQSDNVRDGSLQFTYSGATGPNMWAKINPNFSTCGVGKSQSPINIWTANAVLNRDLKPLRRSYGSCNVTLINNKFNIGVKYPDHTGVLEVDGKKYNLKQMHWHSPSEHMINGKQYAAELHLVHFADDGNVTVIAILFDYGHPDPLLAKMQKPLNQLAIEVKRHDENPITFGPFHPTEVRKRCRKYYRYVGSFTTPPCTQNVLWHILAKVRTVSRAQVETLRAPLDLRCKHNARPCQPINGRHVELYDEDAVA